MILLALEDARASMGFQFQSIGTAAPLLAPSLGLARSDIGTLVGLYMLPGVVVALPGGVLGAHFGDTSDAATSLAPNIDDRRYPASLAGPRYPEGIATVSQDALEQLIVERRVERFVFAYSDVSHAEVMAIAQRCLALGADFALPGPAFLRTSWDRQATRRSHNSAIIAAPASPSAGWA